jgi:fibronectin-binding autotransporter adhesin
LNGWLCWRQKTNDNQLMIMRTNMIRPATGCFLIGLLSLMFISQAHAGDVFKADSVNLYNDGLSWVGGIAPLASDVGVWDNNNTSVSAANLTNLLGADLSWQGMRIATVSAPVQVSAGNNLTLGSAGIDMSAAAQNLALSNTVTIGAAQSWNAASGRTIAAGGAVAINNLLTVNGAGNVILGAANTGSGGVTLNSGTLTLNAAASSGVATTLTLNGGTLALNADPSSGININIGGPVLVTIGGNRVMGGNSASTTIGGSGTLTFSGLSSGRVFTFSGTMSGFTGTVDLGANGGQFRFNSGGGNPALGNAGAAFNLGTSTGSMVNRNGGITISLGSLSGGSTTTLSGRSNGSGATSTTYSIGGLGTDSVFAGTIANGGDTSGVNLIKVGAGKLTLSGANNSAGTTTVNAGTLQVDGTFSGVGTVTVGASGKLMGNGTINGATTVSGEIAPGASIGTLTFSNSLVLAGLTTLEIDRNNTQNADLLKVQGLLTLGGTLTVTNIGANLVGGETFNLLDWGSVSSSFAITNLPALDNPALTWDLSQWDTSGILSVVPEPSSVALALIGGAALLWQARQRRS